MHPELDRTEPPYQQIIRHYRDAITTGALASGVRLPSTRALSGTWGVAHTTISKALRQLRSEGLVATSNQGVFVTWHETSAYSPRDRLRAHRATGRIYPVSDHSEITGAGLVTPPEHVAEAMGLPGPGAQVVRRARINYHGETPVTYSVSWLPGDLITRVPELGGREPIPGGTVGRIAEVTGRRVLRDCYRECARRATEEEAQHLRVNIGDPVLAGQNWWYEDMAETSVLEFGEYTIPGNRWVTVCADDR